MIQSKKDLRFYIAADRIMNGLSPQKNIIEIVKNFVDKPGGERIISYLRALRKYAYYRNTTKSRYSLRNLPMLFWHRRWNKLGLQLGFSIGPNSLGYGVVIPHYGTIVVNPDAHIGNFSVLHTCTCVAGGNKEIGDYFYLSTGSQLVGRLTIGKGVTVAAHSLVKSSISPIKDHVLLAGVPAEVKRTKYSLWTERDGLTYNERVIKVENLRERMY